MTIYNTGHLVCWLKTNVHGQKNYRMYTGKTDRDFVHPLKLVARIILVWVSFDLLVGINYKSFI